MNEELRPCPFCGSEDAYSVYLPDPYSRDQYAWVNCKTCNASGGQFVQRVYPDDKSFSRNEMELESTKLWNARPIEDALTARIAELEALVDELVNIGDNLFDSLNPIAWKHEWLDKWWKLSSCRRGEREE
jgi:Lar family restriction alleviation protein